MSRPRPKCSANYGIVRQKREISPLVVGSQYTYLAFKFGCPGNIELQVSLEAMVTLHVLIAACCVHLLQVTLTHR